MLDRLSAALILIMFASPATAQVPIVKVGPQKIVVPSGKYNTTHFPDQPLSILSERPFSALVVSMDGTKLLQGRDWNNISSARYVLRPSQGTNRFDNGYAGIGGVYQTGKTVYALYHAEDHVGKSSKIQDVRGGNAAMFSIGLAVSRDGGSTFRKMGQVLTSSHPYEQGKECGGIGDISMCRDHTGNYLLAYYADFSRAQGKNIQICVARCAVKDKARPGSWKKFNNGSFAEPGLGGKESYILSMYESGADAWSPHVCYSKQLKHYLMTFSTTFHNETDGATYFNSKRSGIYIASSKDGVNWSPPVPIFNHGVLFLNGTSAVQHATLHLTRSTKNGVKGTLYYAYAPRWPRPTHYLVARSIDISVSPPPETTQANSIGIKFQKLPAGSFMMGDQNSARKVTLTESYEIGTCEVTQEQYQKVMGVNPSQFKGRPDNPVEQVSWDDASEFCRKLSQLPREKAAGYRYRLPTEAEWEYAHRAGTMTTYSFGNNTGLLEDYAWYDKNANASTHPVGEKKPNAWGLYDMNGNVWEWCEDWFSDPIRSMLTNPSGPRAGEFRVNRGGSWNLNSTFCRSAYRSRSKPDNRHSSIGFRVVRTSQD